jgi:hypothetical protein
MNIIKIPFLADEDKIKTFLDHSYYDYAIKDDKDFEEARDILFYIINFPSCKMPDISNKDILNTDIYENRSNIFCYKHKSCKIKDLIKYRDLNTPSSELIENLVKSKLIDEKTGFYLIFQRLYMINIDFPNDHIPIVYLFLYYSIVWPQKFLLSFVHGNFHNKGRVEQSNFYKSIEVFVKNNVVESM